MKLSQRQNWKLKVVAGGVVLALLTAPGCGMVGTAGLEEKGDSIKLSGKSPVVESASLLDQLQAVVQAAETATPILDFITGHIGNADQETADAMLRELQAYYVHNLEEVRTLC